MTAAKLDNIYKCLSDIQRIRILNLLRAGPLCVCHLQEILEENQVKTSKQLLYMKKLGLVSASRKGNWMFYRLADPTPPLLLANLDSLHQQLADFPYLAHDLEKHAALTRRLAEPDQGCR